ncbi:FxSxx-COOH system tetratricopeptide repeat protein [Streptacidiphilus jiangxiensis]|uniref:Flp pilus assembly protein TadD, contains TPR repeats n=1 Tax=Streptacidiphilus jiangxiensis TaxID=235985 RepID=A0A1H7NS79_STRJI|nr:FxSxx-COOH system tetratricopeptide repeat protein [Streptacidiphilus jiangxiensis]SEL25845.1 Flp pilus assembly protein TadD, contains TPR repeats [Streptacidiphilus jiangxiensis]
MARAVESGRLPERLVEVWSQPAGPGSPEARAAGSGWIVDGPIVVTAAHVVDPEGMGRQGTPEEAGRLAFVRVGSAAGSERWHTVEVSWIDRELDVAVLRVTDPRWRPPGSPFPGYASVGPEALDCEVFGFPQSERVSPTLRDSFQARATLRPAQHARRSSLLVLRIDKDDAPAASLGWSGISGAPVCSVEGSIIGLVVKAGPDPRLLLVRAFEEIVAAVEKAGHDFGVGRSNAARAARPTVLGGRIPPQHPFFTGRGKLLQRMAEVLLPVGGPGAHCMALHGLPGVGKSQLAAEFTYRHKEQFDLVWWISATDPSTVVNGFHALARHLGAEQLIEPGNAADAVMTLLRTGERCPRWLLVFDGAPDARALSGFIPSSDRGAVLITSTSPAWAGIAHGQHVEPFAAAESLELLRSRRPLIDPLVGLRIGGELGHLPLALEQVAAHLGDTSIAEERYLELLRDDVEFLNVGAPVPAYGTPVLRTWNIALETLGRRSPASVRILRLCSFLASEAVPLSLFHQEPRRLPRRTRGRWGLDRAAVLDAVQQIQALSLATVGPDTDPGSLRLHPLVGVAIRNGLAAAERSALRGEALELLAALAPTDPEASDAVAQLHHLYPHLLAWGVATDRSATARRLTLLAAHYRQQWGDHDSALALTESAHEFSMRSLGPSHPHTMEVAWWLGWIKWSKGQYAQAEALNRRLLDQVEQRKSKLRRGRGKDGGVTRVRALGSVAADLRAAGDFRAALGFSRRAHEAAREAALSDLEPITARNLAVSLRLVGNLVGAQELEGQVVAHYRKQSGETHVQTLHARTCLAVGLGELGRYREALAELEQVHELCRVAFGPDAQATLHARTYLAVARRRAGQSSQALVLASELTDDLSRRRGADHLDTLSVSVTLTHALMAEQCHAESLALAERVHRSHQTLLGPLHPRSLVAQSALAASLRVTGHAREASSLDRSVFTETVRQLGEEHPQALAAALNLGYALAFDAETDRAAALQAKTVERARSRLGPLHPLTLVAEANQAVSLWETGARDAAREHRSWTLGAFEQAVGADHPLSEPLTRWQRAAWAVEALPF